MNIKVGEIIPPEITPEIAEHIRIAQEYTVTESEWIEIDGQLVKRLPRDVPQQ